MLNLQTIQAHWPDEDAARAYLERLHWQGKPRCPYCQSFQVSAHRERQRRGRWQCQGCKRSFSVTVGTPLQHSHVELRCWLLLIAINSRQPSLPSRQAAELLGVQQRTALAMRTKLRAAPVMTPFMIRLLTDLERAFPRDLVGCGG